MLSRSRQVRPGAACSVRLVTRRCSRRFGENCGAIPCHFAREIPSIWVLNGVLFCNTSARFVALGDRKVRVTVGYACMKKRGDTVVGSGRVTPARSLLAGIVESSTDAVIGMRLNGAIITWNSAAERLYGYRAEEIRGKPASILFPSGRGKELSQALRRLKRGQRVHYYETTQLRKDGSEAQVGIAMSPIRNRAGEIVGASAIARDISDRKRTENVLRQLSARLLKVQDQERRRIARELHDSTAQRLARLEFCLRSVLQTPLGAETRRTLTECRRLAAECSNEIRTLSYLLHPPLLDELGLGSALRAYVEGYNRRYGMRVALKMPRKRMPLPEDLEMTLFRIAQEALTNIYRHSGTRKATIRLAMESGQVLLEVADQGRGMPAEMVERLNKGTAMLGVGIAGMRERVRQLGGSLEIRSGTRGTTVRAVLPQPSDLKPPEASSVRRAA